MSLVPSFRPTGPSSIVKASKERKEQLAKEVGGGKERTDVHREGHATSFDPIAKSVIREAIITDGGGGKDVAKNPDDVLVFSRSVNKVDSSLE